MATTVYSGWSHAWRPSGSSVDKQFRAKVTYSTTQTNTTYAITSSLAVNLNSSVSATFHSALAYEDPDVNIWQWEATGKTVFGESNTVTLITNKSHTFTRKTSAYTVQLTGEVWSYNGTWGSKYDGEEVYKVVKFTVPARPSYAVTYNANGGSGAPASQTKWYDTTLKLQTGTPTRTYYTFKSWNTKADGTGTTYASGANYTGNAAITLYAQWTPLTWTITYNANGGTGSASSTKTANVTLTLNNGASFSRSYYTIKGWNTKADGTGTHYALGGAYTANGSSITLYAEWNLNYTYPTISDSKCYRVKDSSSTPEKYDTGECIYVEFSYEYGKITDPTEPVDSRVSTCVITIDGNVVYDNIDLDNSGTFSQIFENLSDPYSVDITHSVVVKLYDNVKADGTVVSFTIPTATFPIDLIADNNQVYMGVMHLAEEGKKLTVPSLDVDKGDIIIRRPDIDTTQANNGVSTTVWPALIVMDKNNRVIGRFETSVEPGGNIGMFAYARNYDANGDYTQAGYKINVAKNGTATAYINGKDPFNSSNQSSGTLADARIPDNILRKGELVAQSFSKNNVSISAGGYVSGQTISVAKTGYTPICIVNYFCSNSASGGQNVSWCNIYTMTLSGTTVTAAVRNYSSNAAKVDIHVTVLFRES